MTDPIAQIDALTEVLGRLGIEIRSEFLGGAGGGLCRVHGRRVLFLDLDTDSATRLECCLSALASVPEAESIYISPVLREQIERIRSSPE